MLKVKFCINFVLTITMVEDAIILNNKTILIKNYIKNKKI